MASELHGMAHGKLHGMAHGRHYGMDHMDHYGMDHMDHYGMDHHEDHYGMMDPMEKKLYDMFESLPEADKKILMDVTGDAITGTSVDFSVCKKTETDICPMIMDVCKDLEQANGPGEKVCSALAMACQAGDISIKTSVTLGAKTKVCPLLSAMCTAAPGKAGGLCKGIHALCATK